MTVLDFAGKNLALSFIAHELADGQAPPYVHLVSTKCHSRDRCSQAFPVFRALPLPRSILNANRRTKKRGRPENEAILTCCAGYHSMHRTMYIFLSYRHFLSYSSPWSHAARIREVLLQLGFHRTLSCPRVYDSPFNLCHVQSICLTNVPFPKPMYFCF